MCKLVFKDRRNQSKSSRSLIRGFTRHFWLYSLRSHRSIQSQSHESISVHRIEKPHPKCSTCGQQFSCTGNLNRHMKLHSEYERIECEICHETYANLSNFKIHIRRKHKLEFEQNIEVKYVTTVDGKRKRPVYN